jgi:hypothetical protein
VLLCFLDFGTRWGEGSASRPGRFLPPGKTRYPLYRRLSGPQRRYGQMRKISPQPGFDPRTIQPVDSRYTDWATPPTRTMIQLILVQCSTLFLDFGTRWGERSSLRPGCFLPPGKTRYPLYRRLGGPQRRSGQVRKISPPPGFDPRTIQPVASRYTDWATRPTRTMKQLTESRCDPLLLLCNIFIIHIIEINIYHSIRIFPYNLLNIFLSKTTFLRQIFLDYKLPK